MLVAVQSPEGNKRIDCKQTDSITTFLTKVKSAFDLESILTFSIYKDRCRKQLLTSSDRKKLSNYDIKHGDTVYLVPNTTSTSTPTSNSSNESPVTSNSPIVSNSPQKNSSSNVDTISEDLSTLKEDEVDLILMKQSGCIQRERKPNLCNHGPKGKCVHCMSIEPYDEGYLHEQNIKHMSFHSYLRKLTGGIDKGKYAPLENISCKIKSGCKEHLPWPQGICTKCQPNALTLNRQPYRHVDNIAFENPSLVERYLQYWRLTGNQRIGFLYGYYEVHKDVPLGVRATVVAIYEPPQEGTRDSISLLPDEKAEAVDKIAETLGLRKVGWIFTDLIAEDLQGTVKHIRNIKSHFLSAQECIMAGHLQNQHPNVCKLSPDGYFGSKFVTICFTGDSNNLAHTEGYQVSNQCMALVRDNCLLPTVDAPELAYVRESSNEQYVPDVFYKEKDGYGNEITQIARPLPVEYLLVDVPVSTPNEPQYTFFFDEKIKPFPIENRLLLDGHIQEFPALVSYLRQFKQDQFLEALSDFHLLIYIATMDVFPLMDYLSPLLTAVKNKDKVSATEWSKNDCWATLEQLLDADGTAAPRLVPSVNNSTTSNSDSSLWICSYCTFLNQPQVNTCEMCSLPH